MSKFRKWWRDNPLLNAPVVSERALPNLQDLPRLWRLWIILRLYRWSRTQLERAGLANTHRTGYEKFSDSEIDAALASIEESVEYEKS